MNTPASGTGRRSRRDWAVDVALFVLAAVFGLVTAVIRLSSSLVSEPTWLLALDQVVGALGCAALWLRRRRPTELALVLVVLSAFFETVSGAMLVGLFTVAIHRRPGTTWALFGLSLLTATVFVSLRPDPDGSPAVLVWMLGVAVQSAVVGWGLFIRHRRQLITSLREQAARAGTEAALRAEQAQQRARDDMAREIHDVLGHRLSLLSVHAGALEYRPGASAEDVARAAAVIRESAHQALQDLRDVVGVLRAPSGEEIDSAGTRPQPTLVDLPRLVAESRAAGMAVTLSSEPQGAVPDQLGRTAYRVVQEALTNARKHAAGGPVVVSVSGHAGAGLTVTVTDVGDPSSQSGPTGHALATGAGTGLVGLAERVALVGGRLEYGPELGAGWRVSAWLPWSGEREEGR